MIANLNSSRRSGLDANSVLSSVQTFDPNASCDDMTFQLCSPRALSSYKLYVDSFRLIYRINSDRKAGCAVAVGRYPDRSYIGGNPWYVVGRACV